MGTTAVASVNVNSFKEYSASDFQIEHKLKEKKSAENIT